MSDRGNKENKNNKYFQLVPSVGVIAAIIVGKRNEKLVKTGEIIE